MPRRKNTATDNTKKTERRTDKVPPRLLGMKDWVAQDGRYFEALQDQARLFAQLYGFAPVKTPILESFELFKKSTRRNNDKEFYFVDNEKSEKVILRSEITQGIIRSHLENNNGEGTLNAKLFSLGPIFRREKFQTGHYRESTQLDLEIVGDHKPLTEALMIAASHNFFSRLDIKIQVQINSLGTAENRREYCVKY